MDQNRKLIISRRATILGMSSAVASTFIISPLQAAEKTLIQTPSQTEGPFYPESWTGDIDNDLVVVKGQDAKSLGKVFHLNGTVSDISGNSIPSALVEIWQCDANGVYHHSEDRSPTRRHDKGFQGYGRTLTDKKGHYTFRTIRPVSYPGRTPHIHFKVKTKNKSVLTTQMYVFGEPQNKADFIFNSISDTKLRDRLVVKLTLADRLEQDALGGTFNIILA